MVFQDKGRKSGGQEKVESYLLGVILTCLKGCSSTPWNIKNPFEFVKTNIKTHLHHSHVKNDLAKRINT